MAGDPWIYGLPFVTSPYMPGDLIVMDPKALKKLSDRELNKAFSDQVTAGRRTAYPTYYVAYEYIDGSYRPTAATDLNGVTNISLLGTGEGNLDWLTKRVDEIVAIGKRGR